MSAETVIQSTQRLGLRLPSHERFARVVDRLTSRELPEAHFNAAHVFPIRIESWKKTLSQLVPTRENYLEFRRSQSNRPKVQILVTSSNWLWKASPSPAEGQLLFLGGRIRTPEGEEQGETAAQAAVRELQEEAHLFGITPDDIRPLTTRHNVRFDIKRGLITKKASRIVYDTEEIFMTETPSFLVPHTYDPQDRAREIIGIDPEQLETLFRDEVVILPNGQNGKVVLLADTLTRSNSPIRKRQNAQSDERETEELKNQMLYQANLYETQTQLEIMERLLSSTEINLRDYMVKQWIKILSSYLPGYYEEIRRQLQRDVQDASVESPSPTLLFQTANTVDKAGRKEAATNALATLSLEQLKQLRIDFSPIFSAVEEHISGDDVDLAKAGDIIPQDIAGLAEETGENRLQTNLRKRAKLIREIRLAIQTVALENNLRFIKNAGPQQAFLFMQSLLAHERLTPYDYQLMEEFPEVKNMFDLICQTFDVNPQSPDWYRNLENRLTRYHELKRKMDRNGADVIEEEYVRKRRNALYEGYASLHGISTSYVNLTTRNAVEFHRYIDTALAKAFSENVRSLLVPVISDNQYLDLDEIILGGFGVGYDKTNPSYLEKRWVDWKILISGNNILVAEDLHNKAHKAADRDPFAMVHTSLSKRKLGEEYLTSPHPYTRFVLAYSWDGSKYHHPVYGTLDFSGIPIEVLTKFRPKDSFSIGRKRLERGSLAEGGNIDDYLGRMLILDIDSFWNEVSKRYKKLKRDSVLGQQISSDFTRTVIGFIVSEYQKLIQYGYDYSFKKLRDEGILQGIIPTRKKYSGSKATIIRWNWLKFVQIVSLGDNEQYVEELQIFPSVQDALDKKSDDENFAVRRLFESHHQGYFPLALVLYQIQSAYQELIKGTYHEQRTVIFGRKLPFPFAMAQ